MRPRIRAQERRRPARQQDAAQDRPKRRRAHRGADPRRHRLCNHIGLLCRRARAADATIVTEPAQQPWGHTGAFADPAAHRWMVTSPPAR